MVNVQVGISVANFADKNQYFESKIGGVVDRITGLRSDLEQRINNVQGGIPGLISSSIQAQSQGWASASALKLVEDDVDLIKKGEYAPAALWSVQNALFNLQGSLQGVDPDILRALQGEYDHLKDLDENSLQSAVMTNLNPLLSNLAAQAAQSKADALAAQGRADEAFNKAQGAMDLISGQDIAGIVETAIAEGKIQGVQGLSATQAAAMISNALSNYVQGYQIQGFASQSAMETLADVVGKINPGMTETEILTAINTADSNIRNGIQGIIPVWVRNIPDREAFVQETIGAVCGPQGFDVAVTALVATQGYATQKQLTEEIAAVASGIQASQLNDMVQGIVQGAIDGKFDDLGFVTEEWMQAQGFITSGNLQDQVELLPLGTIIGLDNYMTESAAITKMGVIKDELALGIANATDSMIQEVGDIVDESLRERAADIIDIEGLAIPTVEEEKSDNESFNKLVEKMENKPMRKSDVMSKLLDEDAFYWYVLPPIDQRIYRDTIVEGTVIEPGWVKAVKERYWYHKQDADIRDHYIYLFRGDTNKYQQMDYPAEVEDNLANLNEVDDVNIGGTQFNIRAALHREAPIMPLHANEPRMAKNNVPNDIAFVGIPDQNNQTGWKRRNELCDRISGSTVQQFKIHGAGTLEAPFVDDEIIINDAAAIGNIGKVDSEKNWEMSPTSAGQTKRAAGDMPHYGYFVAVDPNNPNKSVITPPHKIDATEEAYRAGNFPSEYAYIACYAECDDSSMYEWREFYDNRDRSFCYYVNGEPQTEINGTQYGECDFIPVYRDDEHKAWLGGLGEGYGLNESQFENSKIVRCYVDDEAGYGVFSQENIVKNVTEINHEETITYAIVGEEAGFNAAILAKLERRAFSDVSRDIKVYMLPISIWGSMAIGHDMTGVTNGGDGNRVTIDSILTPATGTEYTAFKDPEAVGDGTQRLDIYDGNPTHKSYAYVCKDNIRLAKSGLPCVYGQGYTWLPLNAKGSLDDYVGLGIHCEYIQDQMYNAAGVFAHWNGRIPSGYTKSSLKNMVTLYKKKIVEKFILGEWNHNADDQTEWVPMDTSGAVAFGTLVGEADLGDNMNNNGTINIFEPDYSGDQLADLNEGIFKVTLSNGTITYQIKDGYMVGNEGSGGTTISPAIKQTIDYLTEHGKKDTNYVYLFCIEDDGDEYIFDEYVWLDGKVQKLNEQTRLRYSNELRQFEYVYEDLGYNSESTTQAGLAYTKPAITFNDLNKELLTTDDVKKFLFQEVPVQEYTIDNPNYVPATDPACQVEVSVSQDNLYPMTGSLKPEYIVHHCSNSWAHDNEDIINMNGMAEILTQLFIQRYGKNIINSRKEFLNNMFKEYIDAGNEISLTQAATTAWGTLTGEGEYTAEYTNQEGVPTSITLNDGPVLNIVCCPFYNEGTFADLFFPDIESAEVTHLMFINKETGDLLDPANYEDKEGEETELESIGFHVVALTYKSSEWSVLGVVDYSKVETWFADNGYTEAGYTYKDMWYGAENLQSDTVTIGDLEEIFEAQYHQDVVDLILTHINQISTTFGRDGMPQEIGEWLGKIVGPNYGNAIMNELSQYLPDKGINTDGDVKPREFVPSQEENEENPNAEEDDESGITLDINAEVYWKLLCDPRMWVVLNSMCNNANASYWMFSAWRMIDELYKQNGEKVYGMDQVGISPYDLTITTAYVPGKAAYDKSNPSNPNPQATITVTRYERVPRTVGKPEHGDPMYSWVQSNLAHWDKICANMRSYNKALAFLKQVDCISQQVMAMRDGGGSNSGNVVLALNYVYDIWRWSPNGTYINLGQQIVNDIKTFSANALTSPSSQDTAKLNTLPKIRIVKVSNDSSEQAVNIIQPHIEEVEDKMAWLESPEFEAILLTKCPTLKKLVECIDFAIDGNGNYRVKEPSSIASYRIELADIIATLINNGDNMSRKISVLGSAINQGGNIADVQGTWRVVNPTGAQGAAVVTTGTQGVSAPSSLPATTPATWQAPQAPAPSGTNWHTNDAYLSGGAIFDR